MELPPDIDGKLLCFRPGKNHAMAQCMEEHSVADPPPLLDQFVVHDGDVSGCAAEADPSQLEPETECCHEGRSLGHSELFMPRHYKSRERDVDKRIFQNL
jgi:hypothetical protein